MTTGFAFDDGRFWRIGGDCASHVPVGRLATAVVEPGANAGAFAALHPDQVEAAIRAVAGAAAVGFAPITALPSRRRHRHGRGVITRIG